LAGGESLLEGDVLGGGPSGWAVLALGFLPLPCSLPLHLSAGDGPFHSLAVTWPARAV